MEHAGHHHARQRADHDFGRPQGGEHGRRFQGIKYVRFVGHHQGRHPAQHPGVRRLGSVGVIRRHAADHAERRHEQPGAITDQRTRDGAQCCPHQGADHAVRGARHRPRETSLHHANAADGGPPGIGKMQGVRRGDGKRDRQHRFGAENRAVP
ncbi:hypothetical protein G6F31_014834 [Rhizopus arrhizus]|nr:hypothetical protein G6F31_014834 [Rhizopus arrhizus]